MSLSKFATIYLSIIAAFVGFLCLLVVTDKPKAPPKQKVEVQVENVCIEGHSFAVIVRGVNKGLYKMYDKDGQIVCKE